MAAGSRSTKYSVLGVSAGPDNTVLMDAVNLDVDTNIDFAVIGPCVAIELVFVSGTAKTGTPSVVINLQRWDEASQTFITLGSTAALTDAGNKRLLVAPDATPTANVALQGAIAEKWRANIDYTGTPTTDVLNNTTLSVYAS